jgi:hypothetical protein
LISKLGIGAEKGEEADKMRYKIFSYTGKCQKANFVRLSRKCIAITFVSKKGVSIQWLSEEREGFKVLDS